jgi:hypothetical protein
MKREKETRTYPLHGYRLLLAGPESYGCLTNTEVLADLRHRRDVLEFTTKFLVIKYIKCCI